MKYAPAAAGISYCDVFVRYLRRGEAWRRQMCTAVTSHNAAHPHFLLWFIICSTVSVCALDAVPSKTGQSMNDFKSAHSHPLLVKTMTCVYCLSKLDMLGMPTILHTLVNVEIFGGYMVRSACFQHTPVVSNKCLSAIYAMTCIFVTTGKIWCQLVLKDGSCYGILN